MILESILSNYIILSTQINEIFTRKFKIKAYIFWFIKVCMDLTIFSLVLPITGSIYFLSDLIIILMHCFLIYKQIPPELKINII